MTSRNDELEACAMTVENNHPYVAKKLRALKTSPDIPLAQVPEGWDTPTGMALVHLCDAETIIKGLQFLAEHQRPAGGQQQFNSEHLHYLADRLLKSLSAAPAQKGGTT